MRWTRAGHDPAVLYDPVDAAIHEPSGAGAVLGVNAKIQTQDFTSTAYRLETVDLIGTDGIWEARNSTGELYGKSRLKEIIRNYNSQPEAALQAAVVDSVQSFRGGAPQEDDMAVGVVKLL